MNFFFLWFFRLFTWANSFLYCSCLYSTLTESPTFISSLLYSRHTDYIPQRLARAYFTASQDWIELASGNWTTLIWIPGTHRRPRQVHSRFSISLGSFFPKIKHFPLADVTCACKNYISLPHSYQRKENHTHFSSSPFLKIELRPPLVIKSNSSVFIDRWWKSLYH